MNIGKVHERLKPLFWLMGEWQSIKAVVNYPTMKSPVAYNEKLSYISLGHPFLNYKCLTWNDKNGSPMHFESGYLGVEEDETSVVLSTAQGFGAATIEEGLLKDNTVTTNSSFIGLSKFTNHSVVALKRCYKLNEKAKAMNIGKMHEKLKPLCWIIGEWRSTAAVVSYPTMNCPINYTEKLSFISFGQPLLNYRSLTWNNKDSAPMHLECGFLRIDEDETSIALITGQNFGVATVEEGLVTGTNLITNSSCIGHMKFVKQKIVSLHRCYKLNEKGQLEYCAMMETPQTPLTQHITALYEKFD